MYIGDDNEMYVVYNKLISTFHMDIEQLTGNLWKQMLPISNCNGVLDVNNGLVVQHIYDWPFIKQIQSHHLQYLRMCYPVGTPRKRTRTKTGWYQSLGLLK